MDAMRLPQCTVARLMVAVFWVAIALAAVRARSFVRLIALVPFGITALAARSGSTPAGRRRALATGAVGTLVLPFVFAMASSDQASGFDGDDRLLLFLFHSFSAIFLTVPR